MKNILEIYDEYKIMQNLQLHQLRVAAVAKILCDNLTVPVDTENVVRGALLHDMGNIIKFDLGIFPESVEPEGRPYWENVKKEYIEKYGSDEHEASIHIIREITGSERMQELVETVDFAHIDERQETHDSGMKIIGYADNRVCPVGVVPLQDRKDDAAKRYSTRFDLDLQTRYYAAMEKVEAQIAEHSRIDPKSIDDEMVAPVIEELKTWQV